jgi:myo-inositol-1-phosphate synthase
MNKIKIAVIGIGNCASSLFQGIAQHRAKNVIDNLGLLHPDLGGFKPDDIEVVAAWDVDRRKVGKDVASAIFEKPNCTIVFQSDVPATGCIVQMGKILDGASAHMEEYPLDRRFDVSDAAQPEMADVIRVLKETGAEVMMNYLPVGSQEATEFYAECALQAGVAFVNNIPVFIASDPVWAKRFEDAKVPLIGDDIKAQFGATIVHRVLTDLFHKRGVKLDRTYQLNTGGNTDFLNMTNRARLKSKKTSKTEAVQSVAEERLADENIHVGPSDYVAWQNDNKVCFLRMEGRMFGGVPMNLEMRLSVEDSPNSAGVAIDMIRCARLALDRGIGGPIDAPASFFCKHPRRQIPDDQASVAVENFINNV